MLNKFKYFFFNNAILAKSLQNTKTTFSSDFFISVEYYTFCLRQCRKWTKFCSMPVTDYDASWCKLLTQLKWFRRRLKCISEYSIAVNYTKFVLLIKWITIILILLRYEKFHVGLNK